MPRLLYTTQNLVDEVRSLLDEQNVESVDTTLDILPSLNRGQDFAFDIYARVYPEPILGYKTLPLVGDQQEYPIPEEVFEDRILKIEMSVASSLGTPDRSTKRDVQRVSFRDISNYESASKTNIPYYYCIIGRKIRFVPDPTGTFPARLWFLRNPEKLVLPQGRVTKVNMAGNYCITDTVSTEAPELTTESDQLGSYVNWVDGQTGVIKATLQIATITDNKITFRAVPTRSMVLNRTVSGAIPNSVNPADPTDTSGIGTEDDYLCPIDGICVPYYGRPTDNFMINACVAEIAGTKLGGDRAGLEAVLQKFEQQVERTWIGREKQMRVQKRSQNWGVPTRRWYYE